MTHNREPSHWGLCSKKRDTKISPQQHTECRFRRQFPDTETDPYVRTPAYRARIGRSPRSRVAPPRPCALRDVEAAMTAVDQKVDRH
jgi:hypothetical protein